MESKNKEEPLPPQEKAMKVVNETKRKENSFSNKWARLKRWFGVKIFWTEFYINFKTFLYNFVIKSFNVLVNSFGLLLILYLVGFEINYMNYFACVALYFYLQEFPFWIRGKN